MNEAINFGSGPQKPYWACLLTKEQTLQRLRDKQLSELVELPRKGYQLLISDAYKGIARITWSPNRSPNGQRLYLVQLF